jgi:hypothetical protein
VLATDIVRNLRELMAAQHRTVKSEAPTVYVPCVTMALVDEAQTKDLRLMDGIIVCILSDLKIRHLVGKFPKHDIKCSRLI